VANEDKATRYQRLRRRATVAGVASVGLVLGLAHLAGPPGFATADPGAGRFSQLIVLTLGAAGLLIAGVAASLPSSFYRDALLTRRYGVLREQPSAWLKDWSRRAAVMVAFGTLAVVAGALLRWVFPTWWWAIGGAAAAVAPFAIARLIQGVTRQVPAGTPLASAALRERLTRLAAKAGLPALAFYQTNVGARTRLASAALVTIGGERRVLLSDTLLADHSDEEVEVVVAHELAHVVHRDVLASQAWLALQIAVSLYAADAALRWWVLQAGTLAPSSALPAAWLAGGGVFLALRPVGLALSRRQEHAADRLAMTLSGSPEALASVVRRLAANHLAEPAPSTLTEWLFHSHPSAVLRMAEAGKLAPPKW